MMVQGDKRRHYGWSISTACNPSIVFSMYIGLMVCMTILGVKKGTESYMVGLTLSFVASWPKI